MTTSDSPLVLRLSRVCRSFPDGTDEGRATSVVDEFSMTARAGESIALWGPSGSGKTTLLNLVAGLLPLDSGSIELYPDTPSELAVHALDAVEVCRYRRQQVGYVFQFFNLIPTLTVAENIRLALELAGRMDDWPRCARRLDALGLGRLAGRFPANLSGGEQQRVAVLRALAHAPALVLADEPTGNLDRDNSRRVADLLWSQAAEDGAALLIATHSDEIAGRADRVVEL